MKNFKGVRVSFSKGDLAHLDDGELKIVAVFSHIMNRLKMLESLVYGNMNVVTDEAVEEARRDAAIGGFLESIILMAGDLKEGWEAIQRCYYGTKVSNSMNATLPDEIRGALKRLPGHFAGDSLVSFLRNNFAFHNSPDEALRPQFTGRTPR